MSEMQRLEKLNRRGWLLILALIGCALFQLDALIAAPETMNFGLLIAVLLGASVLVSALGSGISLRRFLRV